MNILLKRNIMRKSLRFIQKSIGLLVVVFLFNTVVFGQSIGDFRSKAIGPSEWTTITSWETYNGTTWVAATSYPGQNAGSNTVTIQTGHTITITSDLSTASMGTVVVDGNLNLGESTKTRNITLNTQLLSVSSTGKLNFAGQKTALRLPTNAVLEIKNGGDIVGACSNNTEIYIGGNLIAACVGGGSGSITFDDIVNSGGTLSANITLPSANPTYICSGQSVDLSGKFDGSATNVTYNWIVLNPNNQIITISDNTGTLINNSSLTTLTSLTPTLTGTYLVSLKVTYGSISNIKTKTIIVNLSPTITNTSLASRCGTGTVTLGATASAGTINWYAASTGGVSLGTGTSFTTPSITSSTTYYVDATSNDCTSTTRTAVTATVNTNLPGVNSGKWTGSYNSDWFDCRNWEDGVIPTNSVDVIISSTSSNVVIDANSPKAPVDKIARANNLTVDTGKTLSMTNAANLYVSGNWTNNGTFNPGNGTVTFNGSLVDQYQSISKTETFYNLALNTSNGAKGLNIADGLGLFVSNNLNLTNGDIRLFGKAQLIQTKLGVSTNLTTGTGKIFRDQQGQSNKFNYNYWSSPVSTNNSYNVASVLKDGTNPLNPKDIEWVNGYDGAPTNPISLSFVWIYKFVNKLDLDANWELIRQSGFLLSGEGFTLKGSGTTAPTQNYTFVGKPNDGLITSPIGLNNMYLIGNPYPSAIDAYKFIDDNLSSITGTLYFWEQYSTSSSHYTAYYEGRYVALNKLGVTTVIPPGISSLGSSTRVLGRYIPVGQGFLVYGIANGGTLIFDNSQRAFVKEDAITSNPLFRTTAKKSSEEKYPKIRIDFKTATNTDFHRQLLIGFMNELASDQFDVGYDAIQIDTQKSDCYFPLETKKLVIQGKGYFSEKSIIPIGISLEHSEKIILSLVDVENFDSNQAIFIYDNVTQQYYNLRTNVAEITLAKGTYDNRFSLRFNNEKLNNETSIKSDIRVFYSPTTGILNIIKNQYETNIKSVALYNILGQKLAHWEITNQHQQSMELIPKNLKTGVYLVKIKTNISETTQKIMVE
jgi:hypothetical protein